MMMDEKTGLRVDLCFRTLGSNADPYGATEVKVKLPATECVRYTDGRGCNRFTLYGPHGLVLRNEEWRYCCEGPYSEQAAHHLCMQTKANLLCKRLTGVTFDEAEAFYHEANGLGFKHCHISSKGWSA